MKEMIKMPKMKPKCARKWPSGLDCALDRLSTPLPAGIDKDGHGGRIDGFYDPFGRSVALLAARRTTVKTTVVANAMPNVDSTCVWLNKRGSAMFLRTSKINKSIDYT
jgi:hypothetical protein